MSALADIFAAVRLQLDGTGFEAQAKDLANKQGKNVGDGMSAQVSSRLRKATGAAVGAGIGMGLSQAMQSTVAFSAFEERMNEVFTLLPDATQKAMDEMTADVKAFAMETGNTTEEVTKGLYQAISAGVPADNVFTFLEVANKAAKAGVASTEEAVDLLNAVTKGYGDTSAEAVRKVGDLAFQTVKLGQTTFPELSAAMGKVIPVAATMGVKQEELFAVMSTLTGVTGDTSEVVTQLQGSMVALLKPNVEMTKSLKELGYTGAEAGKELIAERGLVGAMKAIATSSHAGEIGIGKLFRNAISLPAIFALTGSQAGVFAEKMDQMTESAGSVDVAFERMESGVGAQAKKFAATMEVMGLELGGFLSKFGPLPLIVAQTFGPSFTRTIGAALGGIGGMIAASITATGAQTTAASAAVGTASGTAFSIAASAAIVALPVIVTWAAVQVNNEESKARANAISDAVRDIIVTGTTDGQRRALADLRQAMAIETNEQTSPFTFLNRLFGASDEREQLQANIDALAKVVEGGGAQISNRFIAGAERELEGFSWSSVLPSDEIIDPSAEAGTTSGEALMDNWAAAVRRGKEEALAAWRSVMDDRNKVANAADQIIINNAEIRAAKKVLADKKATAVEKAEARIRLRNLRSANIDLWLEANKHGTKMEQAARIKAKLASKAMADGLKSKDPEIKQKWKDLKTTLEGELGALGPLGYDHGADYAGGFLQGLKSKNVAVRNQAANIIRLMSGSRGGLAAGGPVRAGEAYIVGERRPELFVPATDGRILPSVPSGFGSGGGGAMNLTVNVTAGGDTSLSQARRFGQSVLDVVADGLREQTARYAR